MRLITFERGGLAQAGALVGDGAVLPLGPVLAELALDPQMRVAELLAAGAELLERLGDRALAATERAASGSGLLAAEDVSFLPPMGAAVLMIATSGNYLSHIAEMGMPPPAKTHGFIVSPHSLTGHRAPIQLPPEHSGMVDWEGEFCAVLGRPCHRASAAEAAASVCGYTLFNDISARDWAGGLGDPAPSRAVAAWRNNILFKQFPTFGPIGPAIVTADEVGDPAELVLTTSVNGEVVQRDRVGAMQFTIGEIISQLSEVYAFRAGDVVTTGTPAGVGFARQPPRYLAPGDEVCVEVAGIGALCNPVVTA